MPLLGDLAEDIVAPSPSSVSLWRGSWQAIRRLGAKRSVSWWPREFEEIEKWSKRWNLEWLRKHPEGSSERAVVFLDHFFRDGAEQQGQVLPQVQRLSSKMN